jgi:hypothetical protein
MEYNESMSIDTNNLALDWASRLTDLRQSCLKAEEVRRRLEEDLNRCIVRSERALMVSRALLARTGGGNIGWPAIPRTRTGAQ